jgi:hypothetical protein
VTSILATLLFSFSYGIWRTTKEFELSIDEAGFRWLIPSLTLLVLLGGTAFCLYLLAHNLHPALQLAIYLVVLGTSAALLFARLGLTAELRQEILLRAPLRFSRMVGFVFSR